MSLHGLGEGHIISQAGKRTQNAYIESFNGKFRLRNDINATIAIQALSAYAFVRSLKNRALKLPAPSAADAVQLLTVHGANCLEDKVVILLNTDDCSARAETSTLAASWPVSMLYPAAAASLASEAKAPASLVPLLEDEAASRSREELNGLYVALARARSRRAARRGDGSCDYLDPSGG